VEIYEGVGNYFRICYDVGDGSKVSFWHDVWCRDQPLKGILSGIVQLCT
jgi:hypothetical protein